MSAPPEQEIEAGVQGPKWAVNALSKQGVAFAMHACVAISGKKRENAREKERARDGENERERERERGRRREREREREGA